MSAELPPEDSTNVPPVGVPLIVTSCTESPERQYLPETPLLKYTGAMPARSCVPPSLVDVECESVEERATLGVGLEQDVGLEARVGGEAGEVEVLVDHLAVPGHEVAVDAAVGLRGGTERLGVGRGARERVGERAGTAGAEILAVDRRVVERAAIAVGRSASSWSMTPPGLVMTTSWETGTSRATFLPVISLTPTPTCEAGLTPASETQPAVGTSIGTGIAVVALTESGTLRARFITADCSDAFAKMGPVSCGGIRFALTAFRLVPAMIGIPFRD
jgi:hypothetical protein